MQKSIRVLHNIFWGTVNRLCHIVCPFAIRTTILYIMGTLYVGIDGLFVSILGVLSLAELGLGSTLTYAMYKPLAENDNEEICALLQFYHKCYIVIGCVILLLGLALVPFIKYFINGEYPDDVNIYILYLIYLLNSVLSYFLYAYKTSLLTAMQRYDLVSNINSVFYILQALLQICLLLIFRNYYLYIAIFPIFTAITNLATEYYSQKHYPQYRCAGNISIAKQKEIITNVKGIIFQKIGGVVLSSVDSIVISAFLGLNILAIYTNYYYVICALFGFSGIIIQSLVPSVGRSCAMESQEKIFKDFQKFNFMYMWLAAWGSSFLLCLYQPFMELWVGEELMLPFLYVILFTSYFFIFKWGDMLHVYLEATGTWWHTRYIPLLAAIVNLVSNIIMVKTIGLSGVILSTIISILFIYDLGYLIIMLRVYFKKMELLAHLIIRQLYYLLVTVFSCTGAFVVSDIFAIDGIACVMWRIFVCLVVPNFIMLLFYGWLDEFKATREFIVNIVHSLSCKKIFVR